MGHIFLHTAAAENSKVAAHRWTGKRDGGTVWGRACAAALRLPDAIVGGVVDDDMCRGGRDVGATGDGHGLGFVHEVP